ncbi:twin-arginine translocation signal domain-containing protein [Microbacterium hydrothermale]
MSRRDFLSGATAATSSATSTVSPARVMLPSTLSHATSAPFPTERLRWPR